MIILPTSLEKESSRYKQIRVYLGIPFESVFMTNGEIKHSKLPDISTENFLPGKNLSTDYSLLYKTTISSSETMFFYNIMLNDTIIGKYRIFKTLTPYIEIILYVIGTGGYRQGIKINELVDGLKMNVKYSSLNMVSVKNTIPRLNTVSFSEIGDNEV